MTSEDLLIGACWDSKIIVKRRKNKKIIPPFSRTARKAIFDPNSITTNEGNT